MQAARIARQLAQNKRLLQQEQKKKDKLAKFKHSGIAAVAATSGSNQELFDLQTVEKKDKSGKRGSVVSDEQGSINEKKRLVSLFLSLSLYLSLSLSLSLSQLATMVS
eukprot:sb/3477533/